MELNSKFWNGKKVLVTGHTGFKGAWLSLWLSMLGARVTGFSLKPEQEPNLFDLLGLKKDVHSILADLRNFHVLKQAVTSSRPDVIFHLAAQSLVRVSYREPLETYATNVMGTVNLLEIARSVKSVKAIVVVTSDKCYENREWKKGYVETDSMGGFDPYSSSKGCAELVVSAYRRSFFQDSSTAVASARAGNVIGGGDWAADRLIPDLVRASMKKKSMIVRNPKSTRPWQFVLDPVNGYMRLAECLWKSPTDFSGAWNFGPDGKTPVSVQAVLESASKKMNMKSTIHYENKKQPHEAHMLVLNSSKAKSQLGWRPRLTLKDAINWTIEWYNAFLEGEDVRRVTESQIKNFEGKGSKK